MNTLVADLDVLAGPDVRIVERRELRVGEPRLRRVPRRWFRHVRESTERRHALLRAVFLAAVFLVAAFFAGAFLALGFDSAAFLPAAFFAVFAADFFALDFFAVVFSAG